MVAPSRNAEQRHFYRGSLESDPDEADLVGGEVWYNSTSDEWRGYDGTDYVTINVSADE